MARPIPRIFSIFFLYIDPLLAFSGVYLAFFDHQTYLTNGVPSFLRPTSTTNLSPLVSFLLTSLGPWTLGIFSLQILLLHQYREDVKIWKIFQFSVLLIDIGLFYTVYLTDKDALLDVARWDQGDWTGNTILVSVAMLRATFLLTV